MNETIRKIESFGDMSDNWNGHGAGPISKSVIFNAINALKTVKIAPRVFPTNRDSIMMKFRADGKGNELELEIFDNRIEVFNHTDE